MSFFDTLRQRCPTIFGDGSTTYDVSCPPGWEKLVTDLSTLLEEHAVTYNPGLRVDQVKSKFGGLRYYVSSGDEVVYRLIQVAERESLQMCESCGAPGKQTGRRWIITTCPEHTFR
jgi:hypothetical protein